MNIALPNISRSFAGNDAATVWVVNAYQLSATVCLLPVSSMVESLGLKRIYAASLTIFVLASLACAFAPTLPVLVGARLIQGAGAAGLSVAGVALVRVVYSRGMVSKGLALVALAVAIPGALGPTIAAAILAVAKWPWLFLVNLPFGLAVPLFINAAPPDVRFPRALVLTGSGLNTLGFGLFVIGVGTLGSSDAPIGIGEIVAGLFCFGLFIRQQQKHPMPMLPI
ncbi:MFS transporter [Bradyrhizobium sp. CB2312]|uniref:MFS transporter n=1 Tax=Bradyrhizobium sp. CB2312 TaxID=3039155 RepID=UPI0024B17E46|nr:MFS transporter [Bradyrhizobium sp. CB2312]WFU74142.1 MFS transporter [Bradyrhizobium sp. CB2312]